MDSVKVDPRTDKGTKDKRKPANTKEHQVVSEAVVLEVTETAGAVAIMVRVFDYPVDYYTKFDMFNWNSCVPALF